VFDSRGILLDFLSRDSMEVVIAHFVCFVQKRAFLCTQKQNGQIGLAKREKWTRCD
jgi:hypothetical protein